MSPMLTIYTIGHSNHTTEAFIDLLHRHDIDLVIDVRSQPYSQWADQFNRELLHADLDQAGIDYAFMGDTLGGKPPDPRLYDPGQERPNYRRMETWPVYQRGMAALVNLARDHRLAVMCSEGDPKECHRHRLITQTLLAQGHRVRHIRSDGTLMEGAPEPEQLSLFG